MRHEKKTRENEGKKIFLIYSWGALVSLTLHGVSGRGCGSDEGDLILGLCRCRSLEIIVTVMR